MRGQKCISIKPELNDWCIKNNINTSKILENALLQEKDKREGKLNIQVDLPTAERYINIYKNLKSLMDKQLDFYENIRNSLLELEHAKQEQVLANEKKEAKIRDLQVKAFEDFKAGFVKALSELKGRSWKEISEFVRSNCPHEYITYFLKEGRSICKEALDGKIKVDSP